MKCFLLENGLLLLNSQVFKCSRNGVGFKTCVGGFVEFTGDAAGYLVIVDLPQFKCYMPIIGGIQYVGAGELIREFSPCCCIDVVGAAPVYCVGFKQEIKRVVSPVGIHGITLVCTG